MTLHRWILAVIACAALQTQAAPVRDQHVEAELVADVASIQPGVPFRLGLVLRHDPHWHTYWRNDGDSGLPTRMRWSLPDGFDVSDIRWPYPQRLSLPPLMSFGYEGEAMLVFEVTPPDSLPAEGEVTLSGRASWLMCKEICIPGKANLSVTLPVRKETPAPSPHAARFAEAEAAQPLASDAWQVRAEASDETIVLTVRAADGEDSLPGMVFFPYEKGIIDNAADQAFSATDGVHTLAIPRTESANPLPDRLAGVLVTEGEWAPGRQALEVDVAWGAEADAATTPPADAGSGSSLPMMILFAFLGGLILNLMPCVFPVISLKVMGFVQQAGEHPKQVRQHGLVFAAGVLVSFWALSGVLLALRAGGAALGWGFQLSSPVFLIALIALFFVMALNLFGVFEIGVSLTGAGQEVSGKGGWSGSFFSGVLATVIATPCSAPLMGAAVGFALAQPAAVSLAIFTSLGAGMAFPYVVLTRYPALLRKLPKPGPWMETMKQAMGFLLAATVVWLFWVLSSLAAPLSLSWVMVMFLLLGLAAWIYGRWGAFHRPRRTKAVAFAVALILGATGFAAAYRNLEEASGDAGPGHVQWESFSPEQLAAYREAGEPVFIDFTAKWCLTCQVNKQTVLRTAEIQQAFADRGVRLMVADWTDQNETIAKALAGYGRQSVPVYVLYGKGGEPTLLPELLTRKIVLDALNSGI